MELFGLLGIVLAAVIGTIGSSITNAVNQNNANNQLLNQQQFSHGEAEQANQRAIENYEQTMSPQAKVQQLKEAGLSTGLMYGGSGAGGGVTVTSQAQTPGANLPIMQNPVANIDSVFENIKKMEETKNIGEDTEKKKQEIESLKSTISVNNATIEKIATENNYTQVLTNNANLDGIIKNIEIEVSQATKQNRIEIVSQQLQNLKNEGEKMLEEIKGMQIDNQNKQAMYTATLNKMQAETCLLWKQVVKTEAETWLTKAQTALTSTQTNLTFAETQKVYKDVENYKNIMAKIEAEVKLIEAQTTNTETNTSLQEAQRGSVQLNKVTQVIGWMEQLSNIGSNNSNSFKNIATGATMLIK